MLYRLTLALFLLVFAASLDPAAALADAAGCNANKLAGLSRASKDLLKCRVRTVVHADPLDPDCAAEVDSGMAEEFAEAQAAGGCASSDELADVTTALHTFEDDIMSLLVISPETSKCAAAKLRAVARRLKRELACRKKAAAHDVAVDAACISDGISGLATGFERRDDRGTCATTGDAAAANDLITDFLAFASSQIDGTSTEPVPTGLVAAIDGAAIELTWTAPAPGSGLTEARLLRRLNSAPTGPDDPAASIVYSGSAEAALDDLTALLPNTGDTARTYFYAVYGCASGDCETTGSHTTLSPTVRQALLAGGYVLHWRHASADVCADNLALGTAATTASPDWWKSCDSVCATATARQLNTTGRTESEAIGDAFATLGIVVGRVVSSEFCRNMETATLMDFGPVIEQSQELSFFVYEEASRCSDTFVMLGEAPAPGTNTALIGHAGNSCSPLSTLAWAEAAIYKPDGLGGTTYIDRVVDEAWLTLP